jgi:hypothetical protein
MLEVQTISLFVDAFHFLDNNKRRLLHAKAWFLMQQVGPPMSHLPHRIPESELKFLQFIRYVIQPKLNKSPNNHLRNWVRATARRPLTILVQLV